jgi:SAM-dependent methyltransferase
MQHDRLSVEELAVLPQKTKKHPETVALYLEHDFLKAYALHTDQRVDLSPEGAIGSHLEWDIHGDWQRDFLIEQGLRPEHRFLEIGCGTGRLARKLVPYLDHDRYGGVEISDKARGHAFGLAFTEHWLKKSPVFYATVHHVATEVKQDFLWAFSVFIHLPEFVMRDVFAECAKRMGPSSRFYFSYVPEKIDTRTGLKQFRHSLATYQAACASAGLSFTDVPWPHQQRIALAQLC